MISMNVTKKETNRNLQLSLFMNDPNHYCNQLPILSQFNELSNYSYDGKVDKVLSQMISISSLDSIQSVTSPQYRAACWILYEDTFNISVEKKLFLQRYILALFLYATNPEGDILIPRRTCDYDIVECNSNGEIIKLNSGEWCHLVCIT